MKILLSNDDGYRAEGLAALGLAIKPLGAVTIVAPDRNRSGASNSLTLDVPVRATRYDTDAYYVNGTPTDCVHLAVSGLFEFEHDIVVSGVNDGANLGDDTLYSGTVAAAVEGRFLGLPAIAISLCLTPDSPRNFASAAQVAARLVQRMAHNPLHGAEDGPVILNVNVPDLPDGQMRGIKVTRLGSRHRSKPIVNAKDPQGPRCLLGRQRGIGTGCRARHGLSRHRAGLRLHHAAANRSDASRGVAGAQTVARS